MDSLRWFIDKKHPEYQRVNLILDKIVSNCLIMVASHSHSSRRVQYTITFSHSARLPSASIRSRACSRAGDGTLSAPGYLQIGFVKTGFVQNTICEVTGQEGPLDCPHTHTQCASSMQTNTMGGRCGSRVPKAPPPPATASGETSRKWRRSDLTWRARWNWSAVQCSVQCGAVRCGALQWCNAVPQPLRPLWSAAAEG
jgi:hypothetical protein